MKARLKYPNMQAAELTRRGYDVIFIQVNGRRCYLIGQKGTFDKVTKLFPLCLEEEIKVPIAKQAMELQLGRIPQTHRKELRSYRAMLLTKPRYGAYPVWEVFER